MKKYFLLIITIMFLFATTSANASMNYKFWQKKTVQKELTEKNPLADHDDAVVFYNTNDLENALLILNKIPDEKKIDLDYLMLANIYQDKGDEKSAIEFLNKSLEINPKFYKPYYNLGIISQSKKNYNEAVIYYKKAIKYNKDFAYGYYNIGVCYLELKNYKQAKSYFNRAILRKNTEPDFYYNLAYTYKKLNNEKMAQKILNVYNKLIKK